MSMYGHQWQPYVPVAKRRENTSREVEKLRKQGRSVSPVRIDGRTIAATFWGKAWCQNLESYQDYENRLPRGRTYVRNGSVVDLRISPGEVAAMVSGSSIYRVAVRIDLLPEGQWREICDDCAGGIGSLVELLQGRFSKGVMERVCHQKDGLFPKPSGLSFSCTCPDGARMCKHVAAAMYGVGARLDSQPELLFLMRGVDGSDMVASVGRTLPASKRAPDSARVLDTDDIGGIFGIEMADAVIPDGASSGDARQAGRVAAVGPGPAASAMPAGPRQPPGVRGLRPGRAPRAGKPSAAATRAASAVSALHPAATADGLLPGPAPVSDGCGTKPRSVTAEAKTVA
jgi:uncharacterized Zn finger protein